MSFLQRFRRFTCALIVLCFLVALPSLHAQDTFISRWQERATATLAQQPKWAPPVVSPYPQLIQVIRADFFRQTSSAGVTTWNYGDVRGINLIPLPRTEVDIFYPDYIQHSNKTADGFGDLALSLKYRAFSGNEKHGAYVVSAFINASVPTGDHKNGSAHPTITPSISGGKGFGRFDVISTFGALLPTEQADTLGRSLLFNSVAQYHLGRYCWPQVEDNATWFNGGANDKRMQNFLTPGLVTGPFKFHPKDVKRRQGVAFGAGIQIATSGFHNNNHNANFTARFLF